MFTKVRLKRGRRPYVMPESTKRILSEKSRAARATIKQKREMAAERMNF